MSRRALEAQQEDIVVGSAIEVPVEESRPKRIPVSGQRDVLSVYGLPPNLVGRMVNDSPGRIQKFLSAGYTFYTDKGVRVGERTVSTGSDVGTLHTRQVGGGTVAYLMVIDKEFYKEDQDAKQREISKTEEALFASHKKAIDGYGDLSVTRRK